MTFFKSKKLVSFLICFSFLLGFFYRHSNPTYLSNLKGYLLNSIFFKSKKHTRFCPPKISKIPLNSVLIIGHAYGSPKQSELRGNKGIAPKVLDLYLQNKENISAIIFSGDVLKEPNIKSWNDFYSNFNKEYYTQTN